MSETRQCDALIYKRDCYRVSRRGGRHFAMHYNREQCSRKARDGSDLCAQHQKVDSERVLLRWSRR